LRPHQPLKTLSHGNRKKYEKVDPEGMFIQGELEAGGTAHDCDIQPKEND
jgi:hypothetical protein